MAFNILVADDSATMRAVIKKTVSMAGVPVGEFFEAENGIQALQVLAEEWVDVILSDINMPEMGGMELLKEVKKNEVYERIPLIFITTESSDTRKEEAEKYGVAGYIQKPFVPETIKQILYDVLEKAYQHKVVDMPAGEAVDSDEGMDF